MAAPAFLSGCHLKGVLSCMADRSQSRRRRAAVVLLAVFGLLFVACDQRPLPNGPTPLPSPSPPAPASTGPIAFVSDRDGGLAIYVADADGSNVTRLIATSPLSYPAWSPDGRRLAFARQPAGIYVVNSDGSGLRNIWGQGQAYGQLDWSRDGSKLAVAVFSGADGGIFVMNSDGSEITRLIGHEFTAAGCTGNYDCGVESPTWSPDGRHIAFLSSGGYGVRSSDLVAIIVDNRQRRFSLGEYGGSPSWSPDGTKIAFDRQGTGQGDIGVVSVDGSGSGRPLFPGISGEDPRWAPDGSILFSAPNDVGKKRVFISTGSGSRRQLIPDATAPVNAGYQDCCAVWAR